METVSFFATLIALIREWTPAIIALFLGGGYILTILYARHLWIFRRNTAHLHAYAEMVEIRLITEQDKPQHESASEKALIPQIRELLERARTLVPEPIGRLSLISCLFQSGAGRQLAAWRLVHDADRITTDLWPAEHIEAYAVIAKEELKALDNDSAKTLAESIARTLDNNDKGNLRSQVKEARGIIFDARDNYYEGLSDWQNKAFWLVTVTTVIVVLLAAVLGNATYLLLGAAGGLLARLSKTMNARSIGFDYGVSWSVLFLAPLVGALTGWTGVLVANFVVQLDVINPALLNTASEITEETNLVLAVLFGFSARLFEGVMNSAEKAVSKKPESGAGETTK